MKSSSRKAGWAHELCKRTVSRAVRRDAGGAAARAPLARAAVDPAGRQLCVLRLVGLAVLLFDVRADARRLPDGAGHGALAPAAARTLRGRRGGAARRAGRIQICELLRRVVLRAVRHCAARRARHHPARRHLVLHLPEPELYDRRLSRQAARLPRSDALFAVHRVLPAAGRRADRQGGRLPATARGGPPADARGRVGRAESVRVGHVQEGRAGRPSVGVRRPGVRDARGVRFAHRVPRGALLRDADLLRLLQLFRHGHRLRAGARL